MCWRLLRQTGKSISFESLANIPRYSAWLAQQDWTDAYERHRANLQLVGLNDQDRRWVLKNPSHLVALDALMTVYPDALVVVTHRDPVTSMASACSLSAEATAGHSTTFVGDTIGSTQLEMLSRSLRTFVAARKRYDQSQFIDVDYRAFVADPLDTVAEVYDAFGLTWSEDAQALRAAGKPTLPTTIGHEKTVNPFLRADVPAIHATLASQFGAPVSDRLEAFRMMRGWKDKFR